MAAVEHRRRSFFRARCLLLGDVGHLALALRSRGPVAYVIQELFGWTFNVAYHSWIHEYQFATSGLQVSITQDTVPDRK